MPTVRTRRAANPVANPKPNYRALAGIEVEGQRARRTPAQMAAARQADETVHLEAASTQQAVLQRIAELEDRIDAEAEEIMVSVIIS